MKKNNDEDSIKKFKKEREKLNDIVLNYGKINTKRFFNLDSNVYKDGALSSKVKELIGLVSSLVLRCDDCILYHIIRCYENKVSDDELEEALSIGLIVGGSITIPHVRRAYKHWDELKNKEEK